MHSESVHPKPMHSADSLPALRVGSSALSAAVHPTDPMPALWRWWWPDPVHSALLHPVPALCGLAVWYCHAAVVRVHSVHPESVHSADSLPAVRRRRTSAVLAADPMHPAMHPVPGRGASAVSAALLATVPAVHALHALPDLHPEIG